MPALAEPRPFASPTVHDEPVEVTDIQRVFLDLGERAAELARRFREGKPFPFLVLDDFLPVPLAERLERDYPGPASEFWQRLPAADQRNKLTCNQEARFPDSIRRVIQELNGGTFLKVLEEVTGIGDLVADTKLVGGGMHQILRGGHLRVHIDYSHHPGNRLNRRLNLLLFLNKDWKEEYGGHFELWDRGVTKSEQKVLPVFNRCVIFATSPTSYHGHPEPLTCPQDRSRKSIALYYYSNGRPEEPGSDVEHNTTFRLRPGDRFSVGNFLIRAASSGWVRDLTPPLFYRWLRKGYSGLRGKG
jgi:hypothetical protein